MIEPIIVWIIGGLFTAGFFYRADEVSGLLKNKLLHRIRAYLLVFLFWPVVLGYTVAVFCGKGGR